jgi:hypothetical protein
VPFDFRVYLFSLTCLKLSSFICVAFLWWISPQNAPIPSSWLSDLDDWTFLEAPVTSDDLFSYLTNHSPSAVSIPGASTSVTLQTIVPQVGTQVLPASAIPTRAGAQSQEHNAPASSTLASTAPNASSAGSSTNTRPWLLPQNPAVRAFDTRTSRARMRLLQPSFGTAESEMTSAAPSEGRTSPAFATLATALRTQLAQSREARRLPLRCHVFDHLWS